MGEVIWDRFDRARERGALIRSATDALITYQKVLESRGESDIDTAKAEEAKTAIMVQLSPKEQGRAILAAEEQLRQESIETEVKEE